MSSPAQLDTIEGAQNRWDELQWVHIYQANVIHGVGDCRWAFSISTVHLGMSLLLRWVGVLTHFVLQSCHGTDTT